MGQIDIPLNHNGIEQAKRAARYLQELEFEHIITSPLLRAKETAEIVGSKHKITPLCHDGLKECYWGDIENTITERTPVQNYLETGKTPPNGESPKDFSNRVIAALNESLYDNELTLVVAHGGIYWAIMNHIGLYDADVGNALPYLITHDGKKWQSSAIIIE